jgi:hypothetical protein
MSMRLYKTALLAAVAAAVTTAPAVAPVTADAKPTKRAKAAKPKITRVAPMRVNVGDRLVIRGKNFKAKKRRNTVIFRGAGGRTAFAKPRRATRRKLVVKVPASVARLLVVRDGKQRPTRLKLRVLAGKFSRFTPRRLSPVVLGVGVGKGPGGTDQPPTAICTSSWDHDGDMLGNAVEISLGTDPCIRDSDRDQVDDGYEVQAAIDLNHYPATPPLPYPGKRPYPNALDPGDAAIDYDGDGLRLREEFQLWERYAADGVPRSGVPAFPLQPGERMVYSDGLQKSLSPPPPAPADPALAWVLDQNGDGVLSDGERDADQDGIGNWDELRGKFTEAWWPAIHNGTIEPKESSYPSEYGDFLDNDNLPLRNAHVDPDMDGDGILDGADDHDHDGVPNQFEIRRPDDWIADAIVGFPAAANPWAYVNPFNPCKPFNSERCHEYPPVGYYDSDEVPPIGPEPPPGYPAGRPATPDGP